MPRAKANVYQRHHISSLPIEECHQIKEQEKQEKTNSEIFLVLFVVVVDINVHWKYQCRYLAFLILFENRQRHFPQAQSVRLP